MWRFTTGKLANVWIPRPIPGDSGPHLDEVVYNIMVPHEKL